MARLRRSFFEREVLDVAPTLLNKIFRAGPVRGRIIEVEAYRSDDPASHTFRGPTARNWPMFERGGHLYVYLSYGLHHCANVVTGAEGEGQAVLVRALEPLTGLDEIEARRRGQPESRWMDGPGKVCAALAIDRTHSGVDLCRDAWLRVEDDGTPPPRTPLTTGRIGISVATDVAWRFCVPPGD